MSHPLQGPALVPMTVLLAIMMGLVFGLWCKKFHTMSDAQRGTQGGWWPLYNRVSWAGIQVCSRLYCCFHEVRAEVEFMGLSGSGREGFTDNAPC